MERLITGTGSSELNDAQLQGRTAAATAVRQLDGVEPTLELVSASVRYQLDEPPAGVRALTGSALPVMTADPDTLLAVVDGVISDSQVCGDETVILAFDCIARMDILGNAYPDEIGRMKKLAGDTLRFGTYTYGEFARAKGVGGVHNATLTTLAL